MDQTALNISTHQTHSLRHAILRPNQPLAACVYPGDDAPTSFHLGIRDADASPGDLIAIASFYREPLPGDTGGSPQLRIRGMAVLPEHRNKGLGRALVEAGLEIARTQSPAPTLCWCNARTTAAGYYEKLGFTPRGDEFEIEGIFDGNDPSVDLTPMYFHYKYLEESFPGIAGQIGWYILKVDDPQKSAEVAQRLDGQFANSPAETKTSTESAFIQGFANQTGDIAAITTGPRSDDQFVSPRCTDHN